MGIQSLGRKAGKMFGLRSHADTMDVNTRFSAGGSSVQGGRVTFDPRINELRNESIGDLRGLRDEATGNQNAFIQARVNPLQARVNKGRGALQRSLGRRNVFGTFANQDITNFDTDTQRALGDATSLATQDALGFRTSIADRIGNMGTSIQQGDLAGLNLGVNSRLGIQAANLGASQLQDAAGQRSMELLQKIIAACSHEFKENKQSIDYNETLEKLDSIPIEKWNYKGEMETHVSPYAEDFNEAFNLDGGQFIHHIDMFGVMMASIKALSAKVKELEAR